MSDPCEDICTALAAWLNDSSNFTSDYNLEFTTPLDPNGELELENDSLRGMFFPYGETEEKIGRGGEVFESFTVSLLVAKRMTPEVSRAELSAFVRSVRAAVRGISMAGYRYVDSETAAKFSPEAMHERNQFESVTRFTYMGTS